MKGLYFLLAIVAIAAANISLKFEPVVSLGLSNPEEPFILIKSVPATTEFEIEGCTGHPEFEFDSGSKEHKATFESFTQFLQCFTQRDSKRNVKRGFVDFDEATHQLADYEVWDATMSITDKVDNGPTHSMELPLELWFPNNLVIDSSVIQVTDNTFVVDSALTILKYDKATPTWTVTIEFSISEPYEPKRTNGNLPTPTFTTGFIDRTTPTFGVIQPAPGDKYSFTFTIGGCDDWHADGTIFFPTQCIEDSPLCVASNPADAAIEVDIQTAPACPVSQVFKFGETIELHSIANLGDSPTGDNKVDDDIITIDQLIYIDFEIGEVPIGITPTFTLNKVCTQATSVSDDTPCMDENLVADADITKKVGDAQGDGIIKAGKLLESYLVGRTASHAATFKVVAEYTVSYEEDRKRNIVVKRAARKITIENPQLRSAASVLSFVPLLLAAVAVLLA